MATPCSPARVERPRDFEIERDADRLEICFYWRRLRYVVFFGLCVAIDVEMYFWAPSAAGKPRSEWLLALAAAAAVAWTYAALAHVFNASHVRILGGQLEVEHGPLPWPGRRSLGTGDIQRIVTRECVWTNGDQLEGGDGFSISFQPEIVRYSVFALMTNGRRVRLAAGLDEAKQALFLQQQIESYLGIADRSLVQSP